MSCSGCGEEGHCIAGGCLDCCRCGRFLRASEEDPAAPAPTETEGARVESANKPDGKPRPSLVDADFIMAMAEVLELGLKGGRNREDWQRIPRPQALEEYRDALLRHALGQGPENVRQHLAATAVNAMILWWHLGQDG